MSFDEVYKKYYKELRLLSRRLNISSEKGDDLIQETFMRFYLELGKDVEFINPRAWLYKVFLNLFKTQINSEKRVIQNESEQEDLADNVYDLQTEYINNEKQHIVIKSLDRLPLKDSEILLLYNNGFSYAEMAEIMEINPNSVGTTLVRAIEKLKEVLKNHYHELFEQN
jgi:RNA polymerase sigma-70 factor (ECF subfamily)